jgi:integrase
MHPQQLAKIWASYREHRRPELAPTTYGREYGRIQVRIAQMPKNLRYGDDYRDYLLHHYAPETARRTMQAINAACKWAVGEGYLKTNPLERAAIRTPKEPTESPEAFSAEEVPIILGRFATDHPYYLPWVQALFWTGARPEELRALRWEHLSGDGQLLLIKEAWPLDAPKPQATKTRRTTRFPLNDRLIKLFKTHKPHDANRNDWIFVGWEGGPFNFANFGRRQWKPTLEALVNEGKINYYGPQYHARHSAITLMLRAGLPIEDVAYLTRTSRKTIMEHYAARTRKVSVPEY